MYVPLGRFWELRDSNGMYVGTRRGPEWPACFLCSPRGKPEPVQEGQCQCVGQGRQGRIPVTEQQPVVEILELLKLQDAAADALLHCVPLSDSSCARPLCQEWPQVHLQLPHRAVVVHRPQDSQVIGRTGEENDTCAFLDRVVPSSFRGNRFLRNNSYHSSLMLQLSNPRYNWWHTQWRNAVFSGSYCTWNILGPHWMRLVHALSKRMVPHPSRNRRVNQRVSHMRSQNRGTQGGGQWPSQKQNQETDGWGQSRCRNQRSSVLNQSQRLQSSAPSHNWSWSRLWRSRPLWGRGWREF